MYKFTWKSNSPVHELQKTKNKNSAGVIISKLCFLSITNKFPKQHCGATFYELF